MSKKSAKKDKKEDTLLDTILRLGLERKIIDISMVKAQVPPAYQEDAAQEIRIAWLGSTANERLSAGEIASYAHTIAFHVALKLRRDMAGPVRLPGSAFRKRTDGSTYVQPGHLAAPIPWEDLAEILIAEDEDKKAEELKTASTPLDVVDNELMTSEESFWYKDLTKRQRKIISMLKGGRCLDQIEEALNIQHNTLQRNIRVIRRRIEGICSGEA